MKNEHKFFMKIAELFGENSTCDRGRVGCIIVKGGRIISTGYNGSLSGQPHCDDVGHLIFESHCVRTIHAEANALIFATKYGIETNGAVLYTTHYPCLHCIKLIVHSGITEIFYKTPYRMSENPFKELIATRRIE